MNVAFTRGGLPESEHQVLWCTAEVDTAVVHVSEPGQDDLPVFPRSATKPFQALPAVRAGVIERFGWDERHVAIGSGSHGGGEEHTRLVAEMLADCGLTEDDLGCGPLEPFDPAAARSRPPSRLIHNCSGKHALALALCVVEGWTTADYLRASHPVQLAMRDAVADAAAAYPEEVAHGTDGCGMCTFRIPMGALARAFARLAAGRLGEAGDRVAAAMRARPELVGYDGAIDTELMRASDGLVAKYGAEGVLGVGLPDGRGLALKVRDGAKRALDPAAVVAVRTILGVPARSEALDRIAGPVLLNSLGEPVGEGRVQL